MSLLLASGQEDATQRHDLYGAVYVLSGTLLSRVSGLASAPIRWGTRTFSGGPSSEVYEAYLAFPDTIQEELAFKLGDESPNHPINIPVRNLPFRHADSLLAAIVDEDYAWEGSQATLYVGYLKPGQRPEDLAPEDWTSIRKLGQFGSPQEVQQDGFRLPLFSRDSLRRQTLNLHLASRDEWPDLDPKDEGRVIPIVIGAPDSWIRMVRINAGVYGFTIGSTLSGTTSGIQMQSDFSPTQISGLSGLELYVHRLDKILTVQHIEVDPAGTSTLLFSGNIGFNIPQGALIQQRMQKYEFLPVAQYLPSDVVSPTTSFFTEGIIAATAFETLDGRIIPFQTVSGATTYVTASGQAKLEAPYNRDILVPGFGTYNVWQLSDALQPPALIPRKNLPSAGADVVDTNLNITDQPEFTPSVNVIEATKQNFPTGPGAAAAAFDGSFNTGYSLGAFGAVNFTFPSVPGGTFGNTDTIRSILHITCQGDVIISDGLTPYFHPTSASKDTYTIVLSSPANFNQTIRVAAQTAGGGIVYEVSWEHELQTDLDINRTTDVAGDVDITLATAEDVGFDMVPIKGILVKVALSNTDVDSFAQSPWAGDDLTGVVQTGYTKACYPTSVFADLQRKYLEDGGDFTTVSGDYTAFIDAASYETALAQYVARNIRLNFAITEPIGWADLERELSMQCRSWAFYGPNGHQLIVLPDSDEAETVPVEASFLLPGTPNPTTAQPLGSPLIERTSPSDIINRIDVHWGRQWHLTTAGFDKAERFLYLTRGLSQRSRDVFGDRYDIDGPVLAWGIANVSVDATILTPAYSGGAAQVQDLADFIADRQGFAKTRFVFETGWPAFGLTQGSFIRVAFAAGPGIYRNVVCEVEDIQTSPINSERRNITARSIGAPQRGLLPAIFWTDLFTSEDDTWADRFTNVNDRWEHYFGVPES